MTDIAGVEQRNFTDGASFGCGAAGLRGGFQATEESHGGTRHCDINGVPTEARDHAAQEVAASRPDQRAANGAVEILAAILPRGGNREVPLRGGTPGRGASRHDGEENELPEPTHTREYTD